MGDTDVDVSSDMNRSTYDVSRDLSLDEFIEKEFSQEEKEFIPKERLSM